MRALYYAPGSAAIAPQAAMEELGLDYDLRLLDPETRAQKAPDYLALNPSGRIPTLVDGDLTLFETGAILLHLIETHPGAGLAPEGGRERALFTQWLFHLCTTPQATFHEWFYPGRWAAGPADEARVRAAGVAKLEADFALLDAAVGGETSFLASGFSALDLHIAMLARWSRDMPRPMWAWPRLAPVIAAAAGRPAFRRTLARQGIGWPAAFPV
ncbi:MAG: glutathione S-transferase family protein [Pseudomonadota bacterium]|nr:glutathione S-transferase family protein [Pseudomonadota bacterium]